MRRIEVTQSDDPTEEVIAVALVFEGVDDLMFLDMFRHVVGKIPFDDSYKEGASAIPWYTAYLAQEAWRDQLKAMYSILHHKVR